MFQILLQVSTDLQWAVGSDVSSNYMTAIESSYQEVWGHRLRHVSDIIGQGNIHLICMVVSLISLILRSNCKTRTAKADVERFSERSPVFALVLVQMITSAAALSFSLYHTVQNGSWKESAVLAYVFILCVSRLVWKSTRCYSHMNAVASLVFFMDMVKFLLPLTMIGWKTQFCATESLQLAFIFGLLFSSFISPRSLRGRRFNPEQFKTNKAVSPEESCSWLSYYVSYGWLTRVIINGFSRDLDIEDLPPLPSYDMPLPLLKRLHKVRGRGCNILWSLCVMFKADIKLILMWTILTATVEYIAPFAMLNLLRYLEHQEFSPTIIHPFVWIALLFLGPTIRSVCYQQAIFKSTRLLVLSRATVIQEVYNRMLVSRADNILLIPGDSQCNTQGPNTTCKEPLNSSTPISGKVESLMSYDADIISNASDMFYAFTASAVSTIMAMAFLYRLLGWPSLLGVLVLVVLTPLPAFFSGRLSRMHKFVMEATDVRLSSITEYIGSIRTLKYFAWEPVMSASIDKMRFTEQQRIWERNVASMLVAMTGDMLSLLSLLAMFMSLVLFTNRPLTAPAAFTSLAITEILRSQYVWLSKVVQYVAQARESAQRIDSFLEKSVEKQRHPSGPPAFKDATLSVSENSLFKLQNLSITFREGSLNVITGATGSGKSSVLLSLLGETILDAGKVICPPDVAYVPQTAWLQNSTIRQNILFYRAFDESRYHRVIEACDLRNDIAGFPLGDLTVVGERGSLLSGGQKHRVSLARALYSSASTLLLDDIFSALDARTTSRVYNRCFLSGLLDSRTIILVTHLPVAVRSANVVIELDHGQVAFIRSSPGAQPDCFGSSSRVTNPNHSDGGSNSAKNPDLAENVPKTDSYCDGQAVHTEDLDHEEKRASGRVPRSMIFRYMLLFGGPLNVLLAVCSAIMVQLAYFSITFWLSIWTSSSEKGTAPSDSPKHLLVYILTVLAFLSLQVINNFIYQRGGWQAARTMHHRLVTAVMGAPITWFDRTPIGQIINRFGLDTQSMDSALVDWLRMTIDNGLRFLLRLASIASIMPVFVLPAGFFCLIGLATGELYSRAEISVKRLVAIKFAPVFSHFSDTSVGLAFIRGRQMEGTFQELLADKLVHHMRAAEAQFNCNRWVSVRSDFCAATIAATAGCIAYYKSGSAGLVGFSLTNAVGLSQTILTLVRNMNELEVELNSFQRISDYTQIEPEESEERQKELQKTPVPASWPSTGRVEFRHVTARYTVDGADVLHDVSFSTSPGERIAIIGRTGSGKSTMALSLLRSTLIVSGSVTIDGIDLSSIPLHRLRRSIGLIPQEPMLFSGDIQSNVDPSGEMDETELQSALSACNLAAFQSESEGSSLELSIRTRVIGGGNNFSNGQRQILGLVRAICRRSRVIIMDEATASVDHDTDKLMQGLIRSEFSGSTIITIAHRLRTIMDYDRVIVLGSGNILEMGSPPQLIKAKGTFYDMLQNSGEHDELVALAEGKE